MLAVLLLLAFLPACSTDQNAGGLTPSCLTFVPEKDPVDGEVTSVWGSESTCDTLQLELVISGIDHVWGASFEIVYPAGISQFAAVTAADSFLREVDGNQVLIEAQEVDPLLPGRVEVGVTRQDSQNNAGVAPTADNTLVVRLFFYRTASSGRGDVTIEDADLIEVVNPGDVPAPFNPPKVFSGGEFVIEN